jgi:medium-chain acyl-[acyl-carrier-protein] hydrolase
VIAAQLPGRGGIADSGAPPALTETADCLLAAVGWALDRPLAVFGHSMGALLAFEFARTMRRRLGQAPLMLIVSAHDAPQHPRRTAALHKLPRPRFWEEIRNLDGTPEGVLDNADLRELAEPSLRRDLEAVETYRYVHERPLNCPIAAFVGRDDPNTSLEGVEAWSAQTDAGFALSVFPGGHFFQVSERTRVLSAVEHELRARVGLALPAIAEAGR